MANKERKERKGNPFLKASEKKSYLKLRGGRKALLTLRQQFSSCSATTTTKRATKAKSKNSKEQPCSALAIIADAGHGLGDFILFNFGRFFSKNVIALYNSIHLSLSLLRIPLNSLFHLSLSNSLSVFCHALCKRRRNFYY